MPRTVEEIRIAERDMPRAFPDLRADVIQHDVGRYDPELPLVDRNDRTVAAEIFTAAGGLGKTNRQSGTVGTDQTGVARQGRQLVALRRDEVDSGQADFRLDLLTGFPCPRPDRQTGSYSPYGCHTL
jgi:hypothetical protein